MLIFAAYMFILGGTEVKIPRPFYRSAEKVPTMTHTLDTFPTPGQTTVVTVPSQVTPEQRVKRSRKTILHWGKYFGLKWGPPSELTCSEIYPCRFTNDANEYKNSDAVLYHGRSEVWGVAPLKQRPQGQIWIYYNQEPPPHIGSFPDTPNIINWTLTYIRTADLHQFYGEMRPGKFQGGFDPTKNYLEGKTKTAAAMISNCVGHRMAFVRKLAQYIDVDVYGGCGHIQCKDCWDQLKPYKFYLAFENHLCKDYVTEKFYVNGLSHGMVPVTINGADLSNPNVAPPGGYIDATKYSSAKRLADFLRTEGSDPEHYNKYFKWHSEYDVVSYIDYRCRLCEAVHQPEKRRNSYQNVLSWYNTAGQCNSYPSIQ